MARTKAHAERSFGIVPVYKDDGEHLFLLVQHHAGHWGFPKGHAEKDETPQDSARRELREETGISGVTLLDCDPLVEVYYYRRSNKLMRKTVTYFVGMVDTLNVTPQAEEVQNIAWGSAQQTRERLNFKQGKQLLDKVQHVLDSQNSDAEEKR